MIPGICIMIGKIGANKSVPGYSLPDFEGWKTAFGLAAGLLRQNFPAQLHFQ